jgi:hypothetical protein
MELFFRITSSSALKGKSTNKEGRLLEEERKEGKEKKKRRKNGNQPIMSTIIMNLGFTSVSLFPVSVNGKKSDCEVSLSPLTSHAWCPCQPKISTLQREREYAKNEDQFSTRIS